MEVDRNFELIPLSSDGKLGLNGIDIEQHRGPCFSRAMFLDEHCRQSNPRHGRLGSGFVPPSVLLTVRATIGPYRMMWSNLFVVCYSGCYKRRTTYRRFMLLQFFLFQISVWCHLRSASVTPVLVCRVACTSIDWYSEMFPSGESTELLRPKASCVLRRKARTSSRRKSKSEREMTRKKTREGTKRNKDGCALPAAEDVPFTPWKHLLAMLFPAYELPSDEQVDSRSTKKMTSSEINDVQLRNQRRTAQKSTTYSSETNDVQLRNQRCRQTQARAWI